MRNSLEFNKFTEIAYNTARNEKPVYINFSATKLSNAVKPNTIVEFTDLLGKVHRIKCSNRKQMIEAQSFLGIFKTEAVKVKNILAEYPIVMGRIPKRFMSELRNELTPLGFSYSFINKLAGY